MRDMPDLLNLMTEAEDNPSYQGFRIRRIEVRNFGGYHGPTRVFDAGLRDAIFSGPNGAGKSTAFDALRLIFRTNPQFNSAGAEKRVRTVETYYLGHYGNLDASDGSRMSQQLRSFGDPATAMGILVVFESSRGVVFTAARLLYMRARGEHAWRYVIADQDIGLDRHLARFDTPARLERDLRAAGIVASVSERAQDYLQDLGSRFGAANPGMAENAFLLIDQAMGAKELGSLTTFVRRYLLPAGALEEKVGLALKHIEDQSACRKAVAAIEAKLGSMREIMSGVEAIDAARTRVVEADNRAKRLAQLRLAVQEMSARLSRRAALRLATSLTPLTDATAAELEDMRAEQGRIEIDLAKAGAGQLENLKAERVRLHGTIGRRRETLLNMDKVLARLSLRATLNNREAWQTLGTKVESEGTSALAKLDAIEATKSKADRALEKAVEEVAAIEKEIADLDTHKSNLPGELLRARLGLARELGLQTSDLPFLAELVRIRPGEEEWEGVANRVLGGLGRQILVEPSRLDEAKIILDGRDWDGARVILAPAEAADPSLVARLHPHSLASKLEINPKHPFAAVARTMVAKTAPHVCVARDEYRGFQGWAVTAAGSVQEGRRIEKDDRRRVDDRRSFILGWGIEDRRRVLKEELARQEAARDGRKAAVQALRRDRQEILGHAAAVEKLLGISGWPAFEDMETVTLTDRLGRLDAEIARLSSGQIAELSTRLAQVKKDITARDQALQGQRTQLARAEETARRSDVAAFNAALERKRLAQSQGLATAADFQTWQRRLGEMPEFSAAERRSIFRTMAKTEVKETVWTRLGETLRQAYNGAQGAYQARTNAVMAQVKSFFETYPEESIDLQPGLHEDNERAMGLRSDWRDRVAEIERDDLRRCLDDLKEKEQQSAMHGVGDVFRAVEEYRASVQSMVAGINRVFGSCPFDPVMRTRARLQFEASEHEVVRTFDRRLKDLRRGFLSETDENYSEQVLEVLGSLRETNLIEPMKDRALILNQKNWFTFKLEEYVPADGDTPDIQRRVLRGEDGLSGGEGERFAMAMLGAGVAQAFGASESNSPGVGLSFIVIDEAFLKSNDDTSRAALDIMRRLGLQVIAATPGKSLAAFRDATARVFNVAMIRNQTVVQVADLHRMIEKAGALERPAQELVPETHPAA